MFQDSPIEKDYVAPVAPSTASEAGLKTNLVQGQDAYGSQVDFTQAGHTLALPDLAVGRLVDTASDISAAVDAYIADRWRNRSRAPAWSPVMTLSVTRLWRSKPRWMRARTPPPTH